MVSYSEYIVFTCLNNTGITWFIVLCMRVPANRFSYSNLCKTRFNYLCEYERLKMPRVRIGCYQFFSFKWPRIDW